jgi:hypothetical protein
VRRFGKHKSGGALVVFHKITVRILMLRAESEKDYQLTAWCMLGHTRLIKKGTCRSADVMRLTRNSDV